MENIKFINNKTGINYLIKKFEKNSKNIGEYRRELNERERAIVNRIMF
ncbi:MAG: hypothetical protein ACRCTZ_01255 [Sarcina sp.]